MHIFEHKNIWRRVKRLWCNSASTNKLEESGDWRAHYWAKEHLKESQETLVQFCEHKPIRRIGRLWCNLASTAQLKENWKTKVHLGQPEDRVQSATRIPKPGPQGRTEHRNWSTRQDKQVNLVHKEGQKFGGGPQGRTENIWNWPTEHWIWIHREKTGHLNLVK